MWPSGAASQIRCRISAALVDLPVPVDPSSAKCLPGQECHRLWFDWFHLYLWQALIILDALVVWLIWLRCTPTARATPTMAA